jgi:DNA-binding transcriptional LysR family regulator
LISVSDIIPRRTKAVEATVFAEERLIGLVPPDHRFARIKRVAFSDFLEGPIVVLSRRPLTGENWRNGSATSIIEMASVEDALSTIRQSGAAAILPDHAVCRQQHEDLTRIVFRDFPSAIRKIAFWRPRNSCSCYAVTAFTELVRRIRSECSPA